MPVRVRFAPSPTGYLHIGGLRTALFNYLYARREGGQFILRIEDTDRTRLVPEALDDIMRGLRWLGIEWDEGPDKGGPCGPYTQSERLSLYKETAEKLVADGKAYRCFCDDARLTAMREAQDAAKQSPRYDRRCRSLPKAEVDELVAKGTPHVIRLAVPETGTTSFHDYLRGEVKFDNAEIDDLVLLKTDGYPTYHLANIVDDHHMQITHVLRGEEWISSTPKHVLLYAATGWTAPEFVHLPVILSPHGGKLSKRDGATHVRDFIDQGYVTEAMLNFLALTGWSLDGETSMLDMATLEREFVLDKIGTTSPVFDKVKLDDYNGKYIRMKSMDELVALLLPYVERAGLVPAGDAEARAYFQSIVPLFAERLVLLSDIVPAVAFFFARTLEYGDNSVFVPKKSTLDDARRVVVAAGPALAAVTEWTDASLEAACRALADSLGMNAGQAFTPIRVAVTGSTVSPPLFETLRVLGRERSLARLAEAARALGAA